MKEKPPLVPRFSLDPTSRATMVRDDAGGWVRWTDVARYNGVEAAVTAAYSMGRMDQKRELQGIPLERRA